MAERKVCWPLATRPALGLSEIPIKGFTGVVEPLKQRKLKVVHCDDSHGDFPDSLRRFSWWRQGGRFGECGCQ